jgi:hypothetical protein
MFLGVYMKKSTAAENPDSYVAALSGWHKELVEQLRALVLSVGKFEEVIKWRHLVYFSSGPVLLIRAEEERVLFGFWRGQRLREIDERLKSGGKYEMATIVFTGNSKIIPAQIKALVKAAVALNKEFGDPTVISK